MKPSSVALAILSILTVVLSSTATYAWNPQWGPVANQNTGFSYAGYAGNGYQTASTRSSWDVVPAQRQQLPAQYLGTRNGYVGPRADRSGPYLTSYGDTSLYFPTARYQDPVFRGAYDPYSGQRYEAFGGYAQNQDPYQVTGIRAHAYPDPRYVTTRW